MPLVNAPRVAATESTQAGLGDFARFRQSGFWVRIFGLPFLGFLAYPFAGLSHRNHLLLLFLVAFTAGYVWTIWRNTPRLHCNRAPWAIAAALVAGAALIPTLQFDWLSGMAFFTTIMLLTNCPLRLWPTIVATLAVTFGLITVVALHRGLEPLIVMELLLVTVSGVQVAIYRQMDMARQLQEARFEVARLAVSEERLRIARDLHDILGQRLSAMALRSELAACMVEMEPDRAAKEMTEVTSIARDTLAEVRMAVSGYRQMSLATELQSAAALLTASGVEVTVAGPEDELRRPVDECAAWVVREAVTNAVRHAHATRCQIVVSRMATAVTVEIRDDGLGAKLSQPPAFGSGLSGMVERVELVGGEAGVELRDGWFVARASIPVDPGAAYAR